MTHFPWKLTRNGSEIYFPEGARRYVSCSIEQIGGDGRLDRAIDGSAVYLGDTAFHRHAITLSCSGHTVAPVFDVWPSQTVTLECPVEFAVSGPSATLAYDPVPGSVYGVDADDNRRAATVSGRSVTSSGSVAIRYRPVMQCIVASRTNDKTQGRADAGWTIRFEDLSGWEDEDDEGDSRVSLGAPGLQSFDVGAAVSLNMAPLASTNSGLPITFSLASGSFPPGVSISSAGLVSGTPTSAGSYAAVVAATSGAVSATQTVPFYADGAAISFDAPTPALRSFTVGAFFSLNLAPLVSTNTGAAVVFGIESGSLPTGLSLSSGGLVSGTPTEEGAFAAVISATSASVSAEQTLSFYEPLPLEGPELEIVGTVAPGSVFAVEATDGDPVEVEVEIGGVYVLPENNGTFRVPESAASGTAVAVSAKAALPVSLDTTVSRPATQWVIPLALQSNMVGWGADDGVAWPSGVQFANLAGSLFSPVFPIAGISGGTGSWLAAKHFAISFLAANPGDSIIFVPGAVDGTSFSNNRWNRGDDLYNNMVSSTLAVLAANSARRLRCVLAQGGEVEASASVSAAVFEQNLRRFVESVRIDLSVPTLPFLFGEMSSTWVSTTPARVAIRDNVLAVGSRIARTASVSSRTPSVLPTAADGNIHFSPAGYATMGQRYAAALATADANRPGTRPLRVAAVSRAQLIGSGTTLTIPSVNVRAGTVFVIATTFGPGSNGVVATSAQLGGVAGTLLLTTRGFEAGAQSLIQTVWRFEMPSSGVYSLAIAHNMTMTTADVMAWSIEGLVGTAFAASLNAAAAAQSILGRVEQDGGGVLIAGASGTATKATSGGHWDWDGVGEDLRPRSLVGGFAQGGASRAFSRRTLNHTVQVRYDQTMAHSIFSAISVSPAP